MIENSENLLAAQDRLRELQNLKMKIEADPNLNHRQRMSELAGLRSISAEIERDIRQYQLSDIENKLGELQIIAEKTSPAEMPKLVPQVITAMQELARAMRPAI